VLDDEPVAYHDVAFQLDGWRIKRITEETLRQKFRERTQGIWDHKQRWWSVEKGQRAWEQFITMCTLDLVQQLDGVPYRTDQAGQYEAQLTIDVGHNRRFFALSLLIARNASCTPSFCIATRVQAKLDHQHETINPIILQDELVKLVQETLGAQPDPLRALLVLRDGRTLGQEYEAIIAAAERLRSLDLLTTEAVVDIVDIHKESQTPLRLWEIDATGRARNPLEGTVVQLNQHMLAITTTGQATLHQGTAEPLLLMREKGDNCLQAAAEARLAVRYAKYPPEGTRGVSPFWTMLMDVSYSDYLPVANEETCVIVQVETPEGIDNLEAISEVEGVDIVFAGPSDLAASLGHIGQITHPDVQKFLDDFPRRVAKAGKASGMPTRVRAGISVHQHRTHSLTRAVGSDRGPQTFERKRCPGRR
jgi:hypothetical protein